MNSLPWVQFVESDSNLYIYIQCTYTAYIYRRFLVCNTVEQSKFGKYNWWCSFHAVYRLPHQNQIYLAYSINIIFCIGPSDAYTAWKTLLQIAIYRIFIHIRFMTMICWHAMRVRTEPFIWNERIYRDELSAGNG